MTTEATPTKNPLKLVVIILAVVAAILLGVLAWVYYDSEQLISDLTIEKDQLTVEMVELQDDFSVLSTNNDSLNVELDREREKVVQLIDRVKETEATNRRKLAQYQKELGTLRSIMKHYIVTIDSLNTLNVALREDAAEARRNEKAAKAKYDNLSKTTDQYAKQIEKGSVVKGRGVIMTAINKSNKDTDRSSRAVKLKTCLNLVENTLAERGPKMVYIRVKGPDGILMTGAEQLMFEVDGEQMIYSASREVDYQGDEVEICIYFESVGGFTKGVYTVDAYTEETKLGSGDIYLK